ncbi:hypothetical protein SC499_02500 [Peribacillus simplex]|uniref:hypothetical protein n=1 Tax=Peribacillus simplex TaxID=1478 RepID=UPI00298D8390|nr:hypothetical protein [Peribacillus simplex]MDW7613622.1 hypothetical protein [Peribacillus simplex]
MSGVVKPLQVKGLPLIFHRFCLVVMNQEATGSATVVMTAAAGSVLPSYLLFQVLILNRWSLLSV